MADIKIIKFSGKFQEEHNPAADSIQMVSFKTATKELTDVKLAKLIDGADAADEHIHDARYFTKSSFVGSSAGEDDAAKPVILNEEGLLDTSFFDLTAFAQGLSHSNLQDLDVDDHLQYLNRNGSRAMEGDLDMDGHHVLLTSAPTAANHAVNKAYADAVAAGLRPKGNVRVATVDNLDATYDNGVDGAGATLTHNEADGVLTIDGVVVTVGDRVLVKDQLDKTQNGIYVVTYADAGTTPWVLTRAQDQDNTPLHEVVNGVLVPRVMAGTVNEGKPFVIVSVGTGVEKSHVLGTDDVVFDLFTSPTQLQAGDGIEFNGNIVTVDLKALGGLKIVSGEIAIEAEDIAGDGLVDDGSDKLAIDWAVDFTLDGADEKAIKASDLASTENGKGASVIGIEDANEVFTGETVEEVAYELFIMAKKGGGVEYTAGAGGVSKGDLVYISANNTVLPYTDLTLDENVVGMALETVSAGNIVMVAKFDKEVLGVLSAATASEAVYWTGTGFSTTPTNEPGEHVYLAGIAKNATDLSLEVRHLYKNS